MVLSFFFNLNVRSVNSSLNRGNVSRVTVLNLCWHTPTQPTEFTMAMRKKKKHRKAAKKQ
jgi:hypothetical protein